MTRIFTVAALAGFMFIAGCMVRTTNTRSQSGAEASQGGGDVVTQQGDGSGQTAEADSTHPHGGAPGQTGEHPQGGPPGQTGERGNAQNAGAGNSGEAASGNQGQGNGGDGDGNRGHGNDEDGDDEDNPGQGNGNGRGRNR